MKFFRKSRVLTAFIALFSVLFMQLAVAAYACPSMTEGKTVAYSMASTPAMDHAGMIGCEGMVDLEQPSLCFEHSQFGNQSSGKPELPNPAPSLAVIVMTVVRTIDAPVRPPSNFIASSHLMRGSTPPLTIQNCCFRI